MPRFVQALQTLKNAAYEHGEVFGDTHIPNSICRAKEYTVDVEHIRDKDFVFKST